MADPQLTMLRPTTHRLGSLASLAITCSFAFGCASNPPAPMQLESIVAGTWGWTNLAGQSCTENPHGFDLDVAGRELTIRYATPTRRYDGTESVESRYQIVAFEPEEGSILLAMEDEKRVDSEGDPVVWRMRFVDFEGRQAYVWERPDLPDQAWGPIVRCTE